MTAITCAKVREKMNDEFSKVAENHDPVMYCGYVKNTVAKIMVSCVTAWNAYKFLDVDGKYRNLKQPRKSAREIYNRLCWGWVHFITRQVTILPSESLVILRAELPPMLYHFGKGLSYRTDNGLVFVCGDHLCLHMKFSGVLLMRP